MNLTRSFLVVACILAGELSLGVRTAPAQADGGEEDAASQEQRRQTRERMVARWKQLRASQRVAGGQREVDRREQPIFSFSESTRDTGHLGTVWVFGTQGRPAAILSLSKAFQKPIWGFELVALEEGISVVMHDGWTWSPKSALTMAELADAPRPADSDARRLAQIRNLARRFTVSEDYFNEPFELRLLPQPVYRYRDEEAGLIDGALFNFAHGTNPEVLAVIECRHETSGPVWSYGFLPLAGAGVTAKLGEKTVWSKEPTRESKAQEMYSTWLESEGE